MPQVVPLHILGDRLFGLGSDVMVLDPTVPKLNLRGDSHHPAHAIEESSTLAPFDRNGIGLNQLGRNVLFRIVDRSWGQGTTTGSAQHPQNEQHS